MGQGHLLLNLQHQDQDHHHGPHQEADHQVEVETRDIQVEENQVLLNNLLHSTMISQTFGMRIMTMMIILFILKKLIPRLRQASSQFQPMVMEMEKLALEIFVVPIILSQKITTS